ncbi:unnamed protein product [Adineta steineri]|uniref:Uncharacterized protein n=1 Tax=Adineta steineri TaxID=433720 RepID=A0A815QGA4_9BILA|nr:unnamed protein product [Adineta steineri]CAF4079931.1 unnamed protein product [Adineta steineri]
MFNHFDIGILNPVTWPRRIINNTVAALSDQKEGIWLGKRSLSDSGVGWTLAPGFDLFHWAIMINGQVYELALNEENKKAAHRFDTTNDQDHINKFHWIRLIGSSIRTHTELLEKCGSSKKSYSLVPYELGMVNDKMNCQQFVHRLYAYARGISVLEATCITNAVSGNILF